MDQLFSDSHEEAKEAADTEATAEAPVAAGRTGGEGFKFGEQLTKLEGIVRSLESGQLELEDSLKAYEDGVTLIQGLQAKLEQAEQKVQVMMGEITSAPGGE